MIVTQVFLEDLRLSYHGLGNTIRNVCVDLTLILVQFLFFSSCCFLFCFQKTSPVRPEVLYLVKYYILVHFEEKDRTYIIKQEPPFTTYWYVTQNNEMCDLYVYTRDFDFCDPFFVSKCVPNHITLFSIVTIFLNNEY